MRKFLLAIGGALGAASAVAALGAGAGHADPGTDNSTYNVVGEPYAKAVAILRAQGVKATFGGAVGSDVPQAQCIVATEKVMSGSGVIQLSLDCTDAAQPQPATPAAGTSGTPGSGAARPTPGAPGVVSVVPVPVG